VEGLVAGRSLGLHEVPYGAARGGLAHLIEPLDAEPSLGAAVSLRLAASARGKTNFVLTICFLYLFHNWLWELLYLFHILAINLLPAPLDAIIPKH